MPATASTAVAISPFSRVVPLRLDDAVVLLRDDEVPLALGREAVALDEAVDLLVADVEPLLELDFADLLAEDPPLDAPVREVDIVDLDAELEPRPPEADFDFALVLPEALDLLPPDDFAPVFFFAEDPVDEDLLEERDEVDFEADADFVPDFEPDDFAPRDLDPDDFDDADFPVEDFFVVAICFLL